MQPQNLTSEQIKAILSAPSTRDAMAAQEAARARERAALIAELNQAELDAAVEADKTTTQVLKLREVYAPLAARAASAREALQVAEAAAFAVSLSADSKINALRGRLVPLGSGAIAQARNAFALEAQIAAGAFSWRQTTERTYEGLVSRTEAASSNEVVAALLVTIEDVQDQLTRLERDATVGPAGVDAKIAELRAGIEAAKVGTPTPRPGPYINTGDAPTRRLTSRVQR